MRTNFRLGAIVMPSFVIWADLVPKGLACPVSDLRGFEDFTGWANWASVLLSVVLPLGIFLGIYNVRQERTAEIKHLGKLFGFDGSRNAPSIVPSYDIIHSRYNTNLTFSAIARAVIQYIFPVTLFVTLCYIGFNAAFSPRISDCFGKDQYPLVNPDGTLFGSVVYTFFGAYLWSISHLVRRVANYDLSPISFFQAVLHLLLAVF